MDTIKESQLGYFVGDVARALGDGWMVAQVPANAWYHAIEHRNGYGVGIRRDKYINRKRDPKTKQTVWLDEAEIQTIQIDGVWPRDNRGNIQSPYGESHAICCSPARGAETVAKDIKRRLLPGYLAAFDAAVEKAKQRNQADNDKWETTRELAAILGYEFRESQLRDRQAELHCYKYHCNSVRINSADSVDLKLSCNRETARRVLQLLTITTKEN